MNMTSDILASLEQLENYGPFHDFCEKLNSDWTETIKMRLINGDAIIPEDYARAKIYTSLKDMPRKMRIALTPKVRKENTAIYQE